MRLLKFLVVIIAVLLSLLGIVILCGLLWFWYRNYYMVQKIKRIGGEIATRNSAQPSNKYLVKDDKVDSNNNDKPNDPRISPASPSGKPAYYNLHDNSIQFVQRSTV